MISRAYSLAINVSTLSLTRSACMFKNVIDTTHFLSTVVLIHSFTHILISFLWSTKHDHTCKQLDGFILYDNFYSLFSNPYTSNISNIYNLDKNTSLSSQIICDHMFSDPNLDHTFRIFGYVLGLYIFSSCMWQFFT